MSNIIKVTLSNGIYYVTYPGMTRKRGSDYDALPLSVKAFIKSSVCEETTKETNDGVVHCKVYTAAPKTTDYQVQQRNKKSRHSGARFEEQIEAACQWYALCGMGFIQKTPEPMKTISRMANGKVIAVHTKQAQPDFTGTLLGGKSIVFDAKYTDHELIRQDAVSETQEHDLNMHEKMGAECYVLVGHEGRSFLVPWNVFSKMKEKYGHKYMTMINLSMYEVKTKLMVDTAKEIREHGGKIETKNLSGYAPMFLNWVYE